MVFSLQFSVNSPSPSEGRGDKECKISPIKGEGIMDSHFHGNDRKREWE